MIPGTDFFTNFYVKSFPQQELISRSVNRITRNLFDRLMVCVGHDRLKLKGVLKIKLNYARIPSDAPKDGYFYVLPTEIWAILNELDGYTLMLPEDY